MDNNLIKKLKDDPVFAKFQKFIVLEISKLYSISDLKEMTNEKAGETVRVRAMASEVLENILKPFLDFREKSEPTKEDIDSAKKRVGL